MTPTTFKALVLIVAKCNVNQNVEEISYKVEKGINSSKV